MNKSAIEDLYKDLLTSWNRQDAGRMASLFTDGGNIVGFDGSQNNGRAEIESEMSKIFKDHQTARFVWKVREVRFLSNDVALLRAVVGMVPPGQRQIKPERNAVQSIIAVKEKEAWKIELFQNTPAQFHGRPELSSALTEELNKLVE